MLRKPYDYLSAYRPVYQVKSKPEGLYQDQAKKKGSYLDYYRQAEQPAAKGSHYASLQKKLGSSKSVTKLKEAYEMPDRKKIYSIEGGFAPARKDDDSQALRKRLQAKIEELKHKNKPELNRHEPSRGHFEKTVVKKQIKSEQGLALVYERVEETITQIRREQQRWDESRRQMQDEIDQLSKRLLKYELRYAS